MSEIFESNRAPEPVGAFPHAKRVGDLLFLSGIGPRTRASKEIPGVTLDSAGNIKKQCCAVFENVPSPVVAEHFSLFARETSWPIFSFLFLDSPKDRSPRAPAGFVQSLRPTLEC